MKKKIVRLTESDLRRIVKRVIKEDMGGMDDVHPTYGNLNFNKMSDDDFMNLGNEGSSEYSEEFIEDLEDDDDYSGLKDVHRKWYDQNMEKHKKNYIDDEDLEFERERQRRLRNRIPESYKKFRRR